ncbi:MAG: hypothetical protein OK457_00035 [Thaumarchaeota archaeon]|nr:hypothetical protein [Nitrososphaerota archaeon]
MSSKTEADKVGEALQIHQANILDIEYLKFDIDEAKEVLPENLKKVLDRLLSHSVRTSKILHDLSIVKVAPDPAQLESGTA